MVLEELVGNTIRYGYDDDGPHEISVSVSIDDGDLLLEIRDDASAFDPRSAPAPAPATSLDDARPGGLGIHLARDASQELGYQRVDGHNVVSVRIDNA